MTKAIIALLVMMFFYAPRHLLAADSGTGQNSGGVLADYPTAEARKNAVLQLLTDLKGETPLPLSPVESFGQLDRLISASPDAEKAEYKQLAGKAFLNLLKDYKSETIKKMLSPYANKMNPISAEESFYRRELISGAGEYLVNDVKLANESASIVGQFARSDQDYVVRREARCSLVKLGSSELALELAIAEIKKCPANLSISQLPGSEILLLKGPTLEKAKQDLQGILDGKYGDSAKRAAANVLLQDVDKSWAYSWRTTQKYLGAQKDKANKLKVMELMLKMKDQSLVQAVKSSIANDSDESFKEKARKTLGINGDN